MTILRDLKITQKIRKKKWTFSGKERELKTSKHKDTQNKKITFLCSSQDHTDP